MTGKGATYETVREKITEEQYSYDISELLTIPEKMKKILEDKERIQWFAAKYANAHDVFFVGRGIDYAVCLEGSLKLKEISYIHSEAYAAAQPARQRVRPEALRHLSVRSLRRNNLPDAQCNQQSNPFFHRKHTFGQHKITDILRRTKSGAQNQTKSTEIITETSCCYRNNSYICIVKQPNSNQILRIL